MNTVTTFKHNNSLVLSPVVFISESVEAFLFVLYHILHTFVDWCAAMTNLLQDSLKDDDVTNHSLLQHINLHHAGGGRQNTFIR